MNQTKQQNRKAFSLVETVTAMGIVSIAVLTLVALIPTGLEDLRKSSQKQAEARIIQSVVGAYQMVAWDHKDSIIKKPQKEFYFDIRGSSLKKGATEHALTALCTVDPTSPTLAGDTSPANYLRRVKIKISNRVYDGNAFTTPGMYIERSAIITNLEQVKL